MNDITPPVQSLKSIMASLLGACILASIILITAILPAEYGIDPTGLGKAMGLTVLSPVDEEPAKSITVLSNATVVAQWPDSVKITVPANSGLEYKFFLEKGVEFEYLWNTEGGKLYFDFHGEPKGDKTGYFKSFKEETANQSSGSLTTPFAGSHGWYWKNTSSSPVTVLLNTRGKYKVLGLM